MGVLIYSYCTAQILNVDREIGGDSTKKKITGNTITSFSSDKLRGNLIDLSNKSEIDKYFSDFKLQICIISISNVLYVISPTL